MEGHGTADAFTMCQTMIPFSLHNSALCCPRPRRLRACSHRLAGSCGPPQGDSQRPRPHLVFSMSPRRGERGLEWNCEERGGDRRQKRVRLLVSGAQGESRVTGAWSLRGGRGDRETAQGAGLSSRGLWKIILGFNADVILGKQFMLFVLSILYY